MNLTFIIFISINFVFIYWLLYAITKKIDWILEKSFSDFQEITKRLDDLKQQNEKTEKTGKRKKHGEI